MRGSVAAWSMCGAWAKVSSGDAVIIGYANGKYFITDSQFKEPAVVITVDPHNSRLEYFQHTGMLHVTYVNNQEREYYIHWSNGNKWILTSHAFEQTPRWP